MKIYQNRDLEVNKFFVDNNQSRLVPDISEIQSRCLDRQIYFRPSNSPLINVADSDLGSCYRDYHIPTGSFLFVVDQDHNIINKISLEKNIRLEHYRDVFLSELERSLVKIYQTHPTVTLCFSGGIDSMMLLAMIDQLDFLSRTRVLVFENLTQIDATCIHLNPDHSRALAATLDHIKSRVLSIETIQITHHDIATAFNQYTDVAYLKCYVTLAMMNRYHDTAFIFGHHGNQVLLHKNVFLDEIMLRQAQGRIAIRKFLDNHIGYYCASLGSYDTKKDPIGIERVHMLQKPWSILDGINNNRIYSPLATDLTFELMRRLDFSMISESDVIDARFARSILKSLGSHDFSVYLQQENISDLDNLRDTQISMDQLDPRELMIPHQLDHDDQGLDYVQQEISKANATGMIPINSLVSIKNLNWLAQLQQPKMIS
jgi:hypothetical protein